MTADDACVRLRGLPFECTKDDITKFFCDLEIVSRGIILVCDTMGKRTGEAFVQFANKDMAEKALLKNLENIGHRYIEIFRSTLKEMRGANVVRDEEVRYDDGCVRLRGLPFECTEEDIFEFFDGLEIMPNGITIVKNHLGRNSGEAYVQFVNKQMAENAFQRNRQNMGHRYIEIFRCSLSEVRSVKKGDTRRGGHMGGGGLFHIRSCPYERSNIFVKGFRGNNMHSIREASFSRRNVHMRPNRNYAANLRDLGYNYKFKVHCVHMRGLPFNATQRDVAAFFKPIQPISIHLINDATGRASGEADVEFATHEDAIRAMGKDMAHMSHRYIELFLNSGISGKRLDDGFRGEPNFY